MKYAETVMVNDASRARPVRVTIEATSLAVFDIQELAQKAWNAAGNRWTDGTLTVSVREFDATTPTAPPDSD